MATLTNKTWHSLPENLKRDFVNSIDQTILWSSSISKCVFKPMGEKPAIRMLSSGKWVVTNTCKFWCDDFQWYCAIDWCDRQNEAIKH